jgi:tetratricopeptide (TPR) repeat protein
MCSIVLSFVSPSQSPKRPKPVNFDTDYQSGQIAFERGEYRQAVSYLLAAVAQVQPNTQIGGEVQIWLVTAFEAAGQIQEAKALCQKLASHPDLDTRQASKQMLYIMQAPDLVRRDEWLTKIPDLAHLEAGDNNFAINTKPTLSSPPKPRSIDEKYPPIDPIAVNTKDNGFIAIALIFTMITLLGLWLVTNG